MTLGVRPEVLRRGRRDGDLSLTGRIVDVDFLGSVIRIDIEAGGASLSFDDFNDPLVPPPSVGQDLTVHFARDSVIVI